MNVSLDGSTAILGELHKQIRCCAASCGDTHCGTQVGGALQQTDQWVFWSHAGFKGPVTKAELCHSFQTGDLEGDMLIYHVSQKVADAKEMAVYYEQWGPHMPGVPPTGCMQDDQALSQKQSFVPYEPNTKALPSLDSWFPEHITFCPAQFPPLCNIHA